MDLALTLDRAILEQLSSKGILAYIAVSLAGNATASTAALAGLVKAQTGVTLEGLKELAVVAPQAVQKAGKTKWQCGSGGEGLVVQNLDSERFKTFVDDLKKYHDFLNPDIPFSMGGSDGTAIRQFLRDHKEWAQGMWRTALTNRSQSVKKFGNGSRTESFVSWIRRLGDYAGGCLNAYNKPVEGSGNVGKAIATEQSNRAARQAFLAGQN